MKIEKGIKIISDMFGDNHIHISDDIREVKIKAKGKKDAIKQKAKNKY